MNIKECIMKGNYYRVGNYLLDRGNRIAVVEEASSSDGIEACAGMITKLPLSPMPLTEDILLNLGFEKCYNNLFIKGCLTIYLELRKNYFYILLDDNQVVIKHVHKLQNLYHSLTDDGLVFTRQFLKAHSS